ncbi:MAG: bifunctional folylpolyglutamate synthase/dihydrofolate synthase [Clostridia bacterium]|nr:bifunctional folylpolyglutamate synthase/dihydrofolate synthase [Clostridia bacterium]
MNYKEALEYIHKINWCFCNPGLERIERLCSKLGDPQKKLKFVHVAGTNGKGSFCAMLSSILSEAGYKTGLFTSPYIKVFNERMAINGDMISDDELAYLTELVRPIADEMEEKPTEFELITAIAFEYFARNNCDYVVLECGLGGRLDSTNIIDTSVLSVITGIDFDHTAILGDTIEKIAFEKAGIIKSGTPCLWCGENEDAYRVISKRAEECNSPFYSVDHTLTRINRFELDGTEFDYGKYKNVFIPLLGEYQPFNASNVLAAIDILRHLGVDIKEEHIRNGLKKVVWHARFEIISKSPLVIADGGHNPEGVRSAINSVKRYFKDEKLNIISGVMADKDTGYISGQIGSVAKEVFCVTPDNPRALPSKEYAKLYNNMGVKSSHYETVKDAVFAAMQNAIDTGSSVLCVGSLYMYSEVAKYVQQFNVQNKNETI